jgi:sugar phosphate isomerase/epimerase
MAKSSRPEKAFRVGVDSYSLKPLELTPFGVLDWAQQHGGEGVQFSEGSPPGRRFRDKAFLKDLSQYASDKKLYLEWGGGEHIPFDPEAGRPKDIFKINKRAAEQAHLLGLKTFRSCSGGLMRWTNDSLPTEVLLRGMAGSLRAQKTMLNDLGITLAIETHFEFTTFELLRLLAMADAEPGDYLGICLDTMNLLTMLEDPVRATKRILPWVVMTHIKDGAIILTKRGLVSFPVEAGKGIIDFADILLSLSTLDRNIHLSLEDHGGHFLIPIFSKGFLLKFPDLTAAELSRLLALSNLTKNLVRHGRISILKRSLWPKHCERRVRSGIQNMKEIVGRMARG